MTDRVRVAVQAWPQHSTLAEQRATWLRCEELGVDDVLPWAHFFPLSGDPDGPHYQGWTLLAAMAEGHEIRTVEDLPVGWRDEQSPGHYRLTPGHGQRAFDIVNGQQSWKQFTFPPRQPVGSMRRDPNGHVAFDATPPDPPRLAFLGGRACSRLSDAARTRMRLDGLGFVYQFHHLLPEFSALENVMLPRMLAGHSRSTARARARELLALLGVERRESHRPARLSGGEQQRVAIARAMANRPAVLLADEPTGNLDEETANAVFAALVATARDRAAALLIATHNLDLAARADGIRRLHNGIIELA